MMNYRLPILIIILMASSGWTLYSTEKLLAVNDSEQGKKIEQIAQLIPQNSSKPSSSNSSASAYNRYMQEGYKATKEQDYEKALQSFNKALKERPQDIYAQQAIQNVEIYQAKQANPLSNLTANGGWLWMGLMVITIAMGVAFWVLFRRFSAYPRDKQEASFDPRQILEEDSDIPSAERVKSPDHHSLTSEQNGTKPVVSQKLSANDATLAVQKTTRIPNRDPIQLLIEDLQETDPKKRRRAIWELAQKADSRAMKPLVDLMIDTDSQERSLILEALSQISSRALKPMNQALAISLQDKNPQVRKNAIRDLTRIYELMSQISQLLSHAIDDTDTDVQETAKWAFDQLNIQMPPHVDFFDHNSPTEIPAEPIYPESQER